MHHLTSSQHKSLSEFMNMVAAGWFTGGVITPFFIKNDDIIRVTILAAAAILTSITFLVFSLILVRKVK